MQCKQRSLSATHTCTKRDFQQNAFIAQCKIALKNLQSERNNRKSLSPRKKHILIDSPYCASKGPALQVIQKLEADWKEFKETLYDSERAHRDLPLRNKLYKNSTTEFNKVLTTRLPFDSIDEDDTDDAPVIIQKVKAFNINKRPKHYVPITRISLQDNALLHKRQENLEFKSFQASTAKNKEKKEIRLEDMTNNDSYLNKVRSRISKKILPLTEITKENKRERGNKFTLLTNKETCKGSNRREQRQVSHTQHGCIKTPISIKLFVNSPTNNTVVTSRIDTDKSKKESPIKNNGSHSKLKKFLNNKIKSKAK